MSEREPVDLERLQRLSKARCGRCGSDGCGCVVEDFRDALEESYPAIDAEVRQLRAEALAAEVFSTAALDLIGSVDNMRVNFADLKALSQAHAAYKAAKANAT